MAEEKPTVAQEINTTGGASIGGDVNTGGGNFTGRDTIIHAGARGVVVGGNISGSTIITGDGNSVDAPSNVDELVSLLWRIETILTKSDVNPETLQQIKREVADIKQALMQPNPNGRSMLKQLSNTIQAINSSPVANTMPGLKEAINRVADLAEKRFLQE